MLQLNKDAMTEMASWKKIAEGQLELLTNDAKKCYEEINEIGEFWYNEQEE